MIFAGRKQNLAALGTVRNQQALGVRAESNRAARRRGASGTSS
jgi:hypothetical protein